MPRRFRQPLSEWWTARMPGCGTRLAKRWTDYSVRSFLALSSRREPRRNEGANDWLIKETLREIVEHRALPRARSYHRQEETVLADSSWHEERRRARTEPFASRTEYWGLP